MSNNCLTFRSLCSRSYAEYLGDLFRDGLPLPKPLTYRLPDHCGDVDVKHIVSLLTIQFLPSTRTDSLKMANILLGFLQIGVRRFLSRWVSLSFPPLVSPYWFLSLHLDAAHDNSMLCYQSNISQRVSTYRYGPNMNFVH